MSVMDTGEGGGIYEDFQSVLKNGCPIRPTLRLRDMVHDPPPIPVTEGLPQMGLLPNYV